jgi:hypothetical protein
MGKNGEKSFRGILVLLILKQNFAVHFNAVHCVAVSICRLQNYIN